LKTLEKGACTTFQYWDFTSASSYLQSLEMLYCDGQRNSLLLSSLIADIIRFFHLVYRHMHSICTLHMQRLWAHCLIADIIRFLCGPPP